MSEIKMQLSYWVNSKVKQCEIDRTIRPIQEPNFIIGKKPVGNYFKKGPYAATACNAPEDVIPCLISK